MNKKKKIILLIICGIILVGIFSRIRCYLGKPVTLDYTNLINHINSVNFQFSSNKTEDLVLTSKEDIKNFLDYLKEIELTEISVRGTRYLEEDVVDCFINCDKIQTEYCVHSESGSLIVMKNQIENSAKMYLIRSPKNIFVRENILKNYVEQKKTE